MSNATFSARLKSTRLSLGLTQAAAAAKIGVAQPNYHTVEKRGTCTLATAVRIADALGVSLDYLAGRTEGDAEVQRRQAVLKQIEELQAELIQPAA